MKIRAVHIISRGLCIIGSGMALGAFSLRSICALAHACRRHGADVMVKKRAIVVMQKNSAHSGRGEVERAAAPPPAENGEESKRNRRVEEIWRIGNGGK